MKNQGNRVAGYVLLGFGITFAVFITIIAIVLGSVVGNMPGSVIPPYVFPLFSGLLILPILFGIGIRMLVKGNKSRAIMKTGRKTTCKVYNVLCVRNGYELIVSFRGDSGNEFKHALYINYRDAALLKPDMTIECYVQGDDCYVDESHIVIKEDEGF